ncbi:MAG: DUF3035 domain-containing protein [Pseudomonadota bacterium]|nr:DUF3035 domain-containing protein [Pseudomonadota bacterium]
MKKLSLLFVLGLMLGLSACGLTKKDLGFSRQGPDETKVVTKQPLILPPEYNVRPKVIENNEEDMDEE